MLFYIETLQHTHSPHNTRILPPQTHTHSSPPNTHAFFPHNTRILPPTPIQLLRDNIERFGGYEVQTEGDSFVIAFSSVLAAVTFCTESQYDLLQLQWPAKVLQLPACKPVWCGGTGLLW